MIEQELKDVNGKYEFVVLEGLKEGNRFFTSFDGKDPTRLRSGEVAYKVILFTNSIEDAQVTCRKGKSEEEYLSDYLFRTGRGLFAKDVCDRLASLLKGRGLFTENDCDRLASLLK